MKNVELQRRVVDILIDMAHYDLSIHAPEFPKVVGGSWGRFDLGGYNGRLTAGEGLTLWLDAPPESFFGALHEMMKLRNEPATINLADGSTVRAELARMKRLGGEAEIELHHWAWLGSDVPEFWLGRVSGHIPPCGNLRLVERGHNWIVSGSDGLRLQGAHDWHLIPGVPKGSHLVLVDAHGSPVEREALVRDVLAMQFCVGGPIEIPHLVGIDAQRRCVAAVSIEHFSRRSERHRSPVPDHIREAAVWIPALFQLVAMKLNAEGLEPLVIAIASYLDAEADHLDGAYLKAQVGLEAFAKRLARGGQAEQLVRDEKAWRIWVDALRPAIESHLVDPTRLDTVFGRFLAARFAPTGEVVRRVFAERGIALPDDAVAEIKKRNYPAHGFLMNSALEHDIDRDYRRLEMIQTLLAALVAQHVGYGGPLKGYDVGADGHRPTPDWWPLSISSEDAEVGFHGERTSDRPSPPQGRSAGVTTDGGQ